MEPRLVFAVLFVSGLAALMWFDRKKVERHSFIFIRRTERGIEYLDKIAKKAPRFWNLYGWTGVFFAVLSIPLMLFQMGWIINNFFSTGTAESGPSAILPGLTADQTIQGNLQAGVTFIPVEYWVFSIAIIMLVHEASHGIIARLEDFEINSVGWMVLGFIPGAFVEPKGEQMMPEKGEKEGDMMGVWDQGSWTQRLKVLSAGSFANYVTALLLFLFSVGLVSAVASPHPMYEAQESFPAAEEGMTSGQILQINGEEVESFQDVATGLQNISVGEEVEIVTTEREEAFTVEATEREGFEAGHLGIQFSNLSSGWRWFVNMIQMAAFLNVAIGMFNMLPAKPLDGGHIVDTFVERFGRENHRKYVNHFSVVMWVVVIGSIIGTLIL